MKSMRDGLTFVTSVNDESTRVMLFSDLSRGHQSRAGPSKLSILIICLHEWAPYVCANSTCDQ